MKPRRSAAGLAALALTACGLLAGCGPATKTAGPTNTTARAQGADPYEGLLHECDLLTEQEFLESLGMKQRFQSFNGAVCRYDVSGGGPSLEVTFYWFETGSLDTEEKILGRLKYSVEWRDFDGQQGILAHPANDPSVCGAVTTAPSQGVIGWWVQPAFGSGGADSCDKVVKLMMKTLHTRV